MEGKEDEGKQEAAAGIAWAALSEGYKREEQRKE